MNSNYISVKIVHASMQFFHALTYYWNYKCFFIFFSSLSSAEQIYQHDFLNRLSLLHVLRKKLCYSALISLFEIVCMLASCFSGGYMDTASYERGCYLVECTVYFILIFLLSLVHIYLIGKMLKQMNQNHDKYKLQCAINDIESKEQQNSQPSLNKFCTTFFSTHTRTQLIVHCGSKLKSERVRALPPGPSF